MPVSWFAKFAELILLKLKQLNQFSKSLHEILGNDSKSHFHLIVGADFWFRHRNIWRPNYKICSAKFRIRPPNVFWGVNQKSAPTIRRKCNLESIPKISFENFENWLSYYNFNEINSTNITNQDTGNFVHFCGIFALVSTFKQI